MKARTSKSGAISTGVIGATLLIILNVFTFAIPFPILNLAIHYIAYGCAEFVILSVTVLTASQLFFEKKPNQKIIGLPILYFGYLTLGIQVIVTILAYVLNALLVIPVWALAIVEVLVIGFGVIQMSRAFFFKARNVEFHEKKANTEFMDGFRARLKGLMKTNGISSIEKPLEDLTDIALGSDPVTNENTIAAEENLSSILEALEKAIREGSEENARETIERTKQALLIRNELCKTGK